MKRRIALVIGVIFTYSVIVVCQGKPSPAASASCDLGGGKTIKTDYSSPRMKGRTIYGGLVAFGQVWRTGANGPLPRRRDQAGAPRKSLVSTGRSMMSGMPSLN